MAMGLSSAIAAVRLLFVFLVLSGAGVTAVVFDSLSFVLIRPLSLPLHRRIVTLFSHAFLLCGSFLLERWAGIRMKTYGAPVSAGSALCLVNHCSNVDWLVGLAWLSRFGFPFPGNAKAVVKASLGRVPIFGWVLQFSEFVFLTRSWEADQENFLAKLRQLCTFSKSSHPLWLILYPEGSRLTPEKLIVSQKYAMRKKFPVFTNVLLPRFKGFTAMLPVVRPHLDYVVDATVMFEGPMPSMATVMSGCSNTIIHVHVRSYPMGDVPDDKQGMTDWLLARWTEKEARISAFQEDITSLGEQLERTDSAPSIMPLYALFSVFLCGAAPVLYAVSRIENGLRYFLTANAIVVVMTALFVMVNLKPSKKGKRTTNRRSE